MPLTLYFWHRKDPRTGRWRVLARKMTGEDARRWAKREDSEIEKVPNSEEVRTDVSGQRIDHERAAHHEQGVAVRRGAGDQRGAAASTPIPSRQSAAQAANLDDFRRGIFSWPENDLTDPNLMKDTLRRLGTPGARLRADSGFGVIVCAADSQSGGDLISSIRKPLRKYQPPHGQLGCTEILPYSARMPRSLITFPRRIMSAFIAPSSCCGLLAITSMPALKNLSFISGRFSMATIS